MARGRAVMAEDSRCVVCMEPIQTGAKKCVACGSYQSWKRHLDLGQNILSLLVALVSVLALGLPGIVGALRPDDERVQCTLLNVRSTWVEVLLANSGSQPGALREMSVQLDDEVTQQLSNVFLESSMKAADAKVEDLSSHQIVYPGTSKVFRMALPDDSEWRFLSNAHTEDEGAEHGTLVVEIVQFRTQETRRVAFVVTMVRDAAADNGTTDKGEGGS